MQDCQKITEVEFIASNKLQKERKQCYTIIDQDKQ